MTQGKIGVTTENIFPVIKKFLYSDHEIFLRELVSNAVDATQKLRTLSTFGDFKGELGDLSVEVSIDKEAGTLTVSDHGIGMTAEDIDKYINQIAFSGAEEFLSKYKETANSIIGHFGLGFYSAFMVAKKVEIDSLSYKEGAEPVRWTCDGSPEYSMEKGSRTTRGTSIVLYIDDDDKQFLETSTISGLLKKYCRFLPVPVVFGVEQEWKDGKMQDTDRPNIINSLEPSWLKKPSELTDEDYLKFYHELYPGQDDPMFWIHLNVDYPFTLTGILYFPKIKNDFEVTKNRIQLYCNQVYVTDSVEGVVPEFMMLLQGVLDSPDIPLNVSRSYLQSDSAVKKISSYITKKVSARLDELFTSNRADFEAKWDDIKIFIEYGMLTDEKFYEQAAKFVLLKDTEGKYFTLDEYRTLVETEQKDNDGTLVYLYTTDPVGQYAFVQAATSRGYSVLVMDGRLDTHFIGLLENKLDKVRFVRVDSDVIDNIIRKETETKTTVTPAQREIITRAFNTCLKAEQPDGKANYLVSVESLSPDAMPVVITSNEYMRRMKEMAAMQSGMSFYGELPDSYTLVVNASNAVVQKILANTSESLQPKIQDLIDKGIELGKQVDGLKEDENEKKAALEQDIAALREEQNKLIDDYVAATPQFSQLTDIALLAAGMLKGQQLATFLNRTVEMLK
ncbi:MAG: molecular chaperone HtpG [Muribaculaceae bacterium]